MNDIPTRASAVIVGAGIVGNGLACHLARLGWRDIVLVDKGPMPNPGGSTGHASNFIFPIEYSKMMMELTRDSTEQYQALGVFTESGGIEVARTAARMEEFRRRGSVARAWGIPAQHLSPAEVAKLVPYLDESVILGGLYFPTVGVVDSLRAGTLMREEAQRLGALTVLAGTEVLGIDTAPGGRAGRAVTAVRTTKGDIGTDTCVICCGVWSPRIARMAGARIPLTPIVHQMISVGPVPLFADTAERDRLPDRPGRGHQHVRAAARRRHGSRLVRAPADHRRPRRYPVHRGVGPLADRDAVHPGRLRPAAAAGP